MDEHRLRLHEHTNDWNRCNLHGNHDVHQHGSFGRRSGHSLEIAVAEHETAVDYMSSWIEDVDGRPRVNHWRRRPRQVCKVEESAAKLEKTM